MQWIYEEISNHFTSWAILDIGFLGINHDSDEEIAYDNRECTLNSKAMDVLVKENSALIVLIYQGLPDVIALLLYGLVCPKHMGYGVIDSNKIGLG